MVAALQRKRHGKLLTSCHHTNPYFTFVIGLMVGALLDRQIGLGMDAIIRLGDDDDYDHQNSKLGLKSIMNATTADSSRSALSCPACITCPSCVPTPCTVDTYVEQTHSASQSAQTSTRQTIKQLQQSLLFDDSIRDLVSGMTRVDRNDFSQHLDLGLALDPTTPFAQHVLVLYGSDKSLPTSMTAHADASVSSIYNTLSPVLSVNDAFSNCHTVKVVLTQPTKKIYRRKKKVRKDAECIAIMSQWESQHVHKFEKQRVERDVSNASDADSSAASWRYAAARPDLEEIIPEHVDASNQALSTYHAAIPSALQRLKPILQRAATDAGGNLDDRLVIVMVCNYGQANLLANFVCAARARGIKDLDRIVVFATDAQTKKLATALGLHVFADDTIFGSMPLQAAHNYSDATFASVMMAKVYCVHLTLLLGYDVLFQDVDIAWYQSPLPFFRNTTNNPDTAVFDMYFQHDGYHHPERFRPIAANTGLYYVRHNARTMHLFNVFARLGDHVLTTKSHQAIMTVLVNEHMSSYGLRVKVLGDAAELFPNGYAFQKGAKITRYMREEDAIKPILFHANWLAKNKKRPAFEATLNWFLHSQCYNSSLDELYQELPNDVYGSCCLATPCCELSAV